MLSQFSMAHSPVAQVLIAAALGYALGSFPTGYLVGRRRGLDIREHGSGNIGATNVLRVLGKGPGYFVFVCDALKGWLAVYLGTLLGLLSSPAAPPLPAALALAIGAIDSLALSAGIPAAIGCILGHNFPVWLRFRGGKGVATTIGVLLGLMPIGVAVSAVVWFASFRLFRYVSLASLLGALALPVAAWWVAPRQDGHGALANALFWFSVAASAMIFWRHRANVSRLLRGTEPRFERKPDAASRA